MKDVRNLKIDTEVCKCELEGNKDGIFKLNISEMNWKAWVFLAKKIRKTNDKFKKARYIE